MVFDVSGPGQAHLHDSFQLLHNCHLQYSEIALHTQYRTVMAADQCLGDSYLFPLLSKFDVQCPKRPLLAQCYCRHVAGFIGGIHAL
jgi:hypothetical protein